MERPQDGVLARLEAEQQERLARSVRDTFRAQYGENGFTPYVSPPMRPREQFGVADAELELRSWLNSEGTPTAVLLGQDAMGSEGLVAHFAHELESSGNDRGLSPVPLVIELSELLAVPERTQHISREELAARALERILGSRPKLEHIRADLNANALVLLVPDYDRMAEWGGPAGAWTLFEGLRAGPGKLLLVARPIWFQEPQRDELELLSTTREGNAGKTGPIAQETLWLVLKSLSEEDLSKVLSRLDPERVRKARVASEQPLWTLARQPALTGIMMDVIADSTLSRRVLASPHLYRVYEVWIRWKLEAMLGRGKLRLLESVEDAMTHLASRIYHTGRLRLQPTGPQEKALLESEVIDALCAAGSFLKCGESGYGFRQGRWLDYFAARSLLQPFHRDRRLDSEHLAPLLDGRRPGAGTLALLAAGLEQYDGVEQSMLEALRTGAGVWPADAPPSSLDLLSSNVLEALVRLIYLRQGLVHADGSLLDSNNGEVTQAIPGYESTRQFWTQARLQEEQEILEVANQEVDHFLTTRDGRNYSRQFVNRPILRAEDGSLWAYVPAGRGIVGSYLSREEDPVRWFAVGRPFLMSLLPVTNREFICFLDAEMYVPHPAWIDAKWAQFLASWVKSPAGSPIRYPEGHGDYPVVNVSWIDAQAFAEWRTHRDGHPTRMASADEWEFAARGLLGRLYPWGDRFLPEMCNSRDGGRWQASPVGPRSTNGAGPFGNKDMAGNVWEWTASKYHLPGDDDASLSSRTLVGGGWRSAGADVRSSRRLRGVSSIRYDVVGFRLAKDISFQ